MQVVAQTPSRPLSATLPAQVLPNLNGSSGPACGVPRTPWLSMRANEQDRFLALVLADVGCVFFCCLIHWSSRVAVSTFP